MGVGGSAFHTCRLSNWESSHGASIAARVAVSHVSVRRSRVLISSTSSNDRDAPLSAPPSGLAPLASASPSAISRVSVSGVVAFPIASTVLACHAAADLCSAANACSLAVPLLAETYLWECPPS